MDIQLIHISKRFEDKTVLEDLNITFPEGRISCLMGPSGSGKTTLINLIMGIDQPDSGEILGCRNRRFAVVFQEDRLIEHWDPVRNIRLVCDKSVTTEQIRQELYQVGLEDYEKPVQDYSGGMRRRVALIRAMLAKSDVLILDEPFKGLDEELKKIVIGYVKQKCGGRTVIVVTHEKEEARQLEAEIISIS
jgi:NitT/TauT family transport system ATP-binding protein